MTYENSLNKIEEIIAKASTKEFFIIENNFLHIQLKDKEVIRCQLDFNLINPIAYC